MGEKNKTRPTSHSCRSEVEEKEAKIQEDLKKMKMVIQEIVQSNKLHQVDLE